jgi:S1-C subfamily serine protease
MVMRFTNILKLNQTQALAAVIMASALIGCTTLDKPSTKSAAPSGKNGFSGTLTSAVKNDGGYDYNTFLVDGRKANLEGILNSMFILKSVAEFILKSVAEFETPDDKTHVTTGQATGVAIFGRFILTVDHAVTNYDLKVSVPNGSVAVPARKKMQKTFIVIDGEPHPLTALLRDRVNDVALFRLPDELILPSFPYHIGNSDDLKVGNFIYVVGNPMNLGFNVREGIVSTLRAPEEINAIDAIPGNAFMVSNGLNPGDSGTPAIAIRDGKFELVGLTQGTFLRGQRLGWVLRINAIMEKIRPLIKPLRKTPLQTASKPSF